jgi:hypothetical protein
LFSNNTTDRAQASYKRLELIICIEWLQIWKYTRNN